MIDATFKLEKNGLILLVAGIRLLNGLTSIVACGLTTNESEKAYTEFFRSIKEELEKQTSKQFEPHYIMSDGHLGLKKSIR